MQAGVNSGFASSVNHTDRSTSRVLRLSSNIDLPAQGYKSSMNPSVPENGWPRRYLTVYRLSADGSVPQCTCPGRHVWCHRPRTLAVHRRRLTAPVATSIRSVAGKGEHHTILRWLDQHRTV